MAVWRNGDWLEYSTESIKNGVKLFSKILFYVKIGIAERFKFAALENKSKLLKSCHSGE